MDLRKEYGRMWDETFGPKKNVTETLASGAGAISKIVGPVGSLCSGGMVGCAPSVAELEARCRTVFEMWLNADPRNKWENDFYKQQLSAAQDELTNAKRAANK